MFWEELQAALVERALMTKAPVQHLYSERPTVGNLTALKVPRKVGGNETISFRDILSPNMSRMLILLTLALATVVHGFEPAVGAVCAEWCIHEPPMVWATTPDCTGCTAHDLPCLDWYDCPSPTPLASSQGGVPPATGVFTERSLH